MRSSKKRSVLVPACLVTGLVTGLAASPAQAGSRSDKQIAKSRDKCAKYGFEPDSDAFAQCVMKLSLAQERQSPDHDTLVRRYRERSMARRGDDRYPVCSAGMMDNELDTSIGKWVGPDCQLAPD